MENVTWPELPCGCGTVARCASCGTCTDCYGCECPRPDYADEPPELYGAVQTGDPYTDEWPAVGRARRAPASNARARIAERRAAKAGPPPHVGPPPLAMEPAEPVAPPGADPMFAGLLDHLEREIEKRDNPA